MDVRRAELDDLPVCSALVAAVQSTHVWQLRLAYDPTAPQPLEELGATLHRSRLPRPITLRLGSEEPLDELWNRAADVLVAEDETGLHGYLALAAEPTGPALTVARLVVAPTARRSGVGTALLRAAVQWGRDFHFPALVAHCAARNDPAVNLYLRAGMRFAGYSEAFYPRNEVALFFQRPL